MALLEARGVSKRFGGLTALNAVDFTLEEGHIASIIGPNGAYRRGRAAIFPCLSETDWRGLADGSELGPGLPGSGRATVEMVARCHPDGGLGADSL